MFELYRAGQNDAGKDLEAEWSFDPEDEELIRSLKRQRTDVGAAHLRAAIHEERVDSEILCQLGYHPDQSFSEKLSTIDGVLDICGPDLLHQISKCFMDWLFRKWLYPLMRKIWRDKDFSEAALESELDCRFALMPKFKDLRRFSHDILSEDHHWTVHEYKAMMKVMVGALQGICPSEGIALLREYLHIHRLSHYIIHTEESLQWLENAVETFNKFLQMPGDPFVKYDLVDPDHEPQKLHYFRHYAECVQRKGTLTSYSTDLTEIHHKPFKDAYKCSNKRDTDYMKFILRNYTVISTFQNMTGGFVREKEKTSDEDTLSEDEDMQSEDEEEVDLLFRNKIGEDSKNDEEGSDISPDESDRIYVWKHKRRKGWPRRASETEKILDLTGLLSALKQYLLSDATDSSQSIKDTEFDPFIAVYDSILMEWPA